MDLIYLEGNSEQFPLYDWSEFYDNVEETFPPYVPEAAEKEIGFACLLTMIMQDMSVTIGLILDLFMP